MIIIPRPKKHIRRATPEELNWVANKLMYMLGTRDVIFSIEKILSFKVLLHVKSRNELFSIYLRFSGRFENQKMIYKQDFIEPIVLESDEIEVELTTNT